MHISSFKHIGPKAGTLYNPRNNCPVYNIRGCIIITLELFEFQQMKSNHVFQSNINITCLCDYISEEEGDTLAADGHKAKLKPSPKPGVKK